MRYLCWFIIFSGIGQTCFTQQSSIKDLKWWRDSSDLTTFDTDFGQLSASIDLLNDDLVIFKEGIDNFRAKRIDKNIADKKCKRIGLAIDSNLAHLAALHFYKLGLDSPQKSFLFYYTKKELNDYKQALLSVSQEAAIFEHLEQANAFSISNLLNAYYYMAESRSLLLASMNSLERYYSLGNKVDFVDSTGRTISITSNDTKQRTDNIRTIAQRVDSITYRTDTILSQPFVPYKPLSKKNTDEVNKSQDKVSAAANTILIDNRRNWWWRTLIGGVIGGLVAGLLVHALR
jgi:hypothetical protein